MCNSQSISMLSYGVDDTVLPIDPLNNNLLKKIHEYLNYWKNSQNVKFERKRLPDMKIEANGKGLPKY